MKLLNFKFILILIALSLTTFSLNAAKDEYTKKISKIFDVKKDALLSIENKFGTIHCNNWDKNSISIEVTIEVNASSQDKANKFFDKIEITISGNTDEVNAKTSFTGECKSEMSIKYLIFMPKTINLDLENKFGDIFINEVTGKTNIEIGYGSLEAHKMMNNKNDLEIKFSDAIIDFIKEAEIEIKYSELKINEALNLTIDSKFSSLTTDKVNMIIWDSEYDDNEIGSIDDIEIGSNFSDVKIDNLKNKLILDMQYGGCKVQEVSEGFTEIFIDNSFADIKIGFTPYSSFSIDAEIKFGELSYPKSANIRHEQSSFTTNIYKGTIGKDENPISKVVIDSRNSNVTIFYHK